MSTPVTQIPGFIAGIWDIDPVHSHIAFVGRHMMVNKVRGHLERFQGQIVTAADPLQSSATVTVDMNSVTTGNQTRDNDLRSDNFFAAGTHPTMTFRSTGIRRQGKHFVLDGKLTVRGATRPVSLRFKINGFATDPDDGARAGFSATGEINRIDFGVCTNPPVLGLASDKVRIEIEAGAALRKQEGDPHGAGTGDLGG
jgi:polyisoprenoid-binding protein YceI